MFESFLSRGKTVGRKRNRNEGTTKKEKRAEMMKSVTKEIKNPVIVTDYPDPDVIRVGDTYYMLSTTMHFLPGAVILRSYDLANWEIVSYVLDSFGDKREAQLTNEQGSYGCGMWAGCLRFNKGRFYVSFGAKKTEGRLFSVIFEIFETHFKMSVFEKLTKK